LYRILDQGKPAGRRGCKAAEDKENGLGLTFREQEKVKSNNGKAKGKYK